MVNIIRYDDLRWDYDRGELYRQDVKITNITKDNERLLISSKNNKKGKIFTYRMRYTDDIELYDGPQYLHDSDQFSITNGIEHILYNKGYLYYIPVDEQNIFYYHNKKHEMLTLYNNKSPNNKLYIPIIKFLSEFTGATDFVGFYVIENTVYFYLQKRTNDINKLYVVTCNLIVGMTLSIDQNTIKTVSEFDMMKYFATNKIETKTKVTGVTFDNINNKIYMPINGEKSHIIKLKWFDSLEIIGNNVDFIRDKNDLLGFKDNISGITVINGNILVLFDHCETDRNYCFRYVLFKE